MTSTNLAFAACLMAGTVAAQTNTLLIVADDLGVDAIAGYKEGAAPPPTPNIDALAANGVLFRNAYAYPACSATRATIHTGRYGFRTGVRTAGQVLPLSELVLPEILGKAGYAHGLIGKWHLGGNFNAPDNHPNATGWGHFEGSTPAFFRGTDTYFRWRKVVNGRVSTSTVYATTENVNDALRWIKGQAKPWVCSLNFNAPHSPFHAPPAQLHSQNLQGKNPRTQPIPFFKAMVQAVDTEIGRLLKSIPATTLAKTNVIFIGDNGTDAAVSEPPFLGSHAKFTVYEGGTNVPLIVSGPAVASPGREVSALVGSVDLFHTILELSGVDARAAVPSSVPLDGVSMVPYLKNPAQRPVREFAHTEMGGRQNSVAIRNGRYKLIRNPGRDQLFDLSKDQFEKSDLLRRALSPSERYNLDLLAAELSKLRDRASWFAFGSGCAGRSGTPALAPEPGQLPRVGQTFTVRVANAGSPRSVFGLLGLSNTVWGPVRLPLDLGAIGMTGCTLHVGIDLEMRLTTNGGVARWSLAIPNSAKLIGGQFYQQAVVLDPGVNAGGAVVSNAGRGCVARQ